MEMQERRQSPSWNEMPIILIRWMQEPVIRMEKGLQKLYAALIENSMVYVFA